MKFTKIKFQILKVRIQLPELVNRDNGEVPGKHL